MTAKQKGTQSL